MQNRVLDAAAVEIDRHQWLRVFGPNGSSLFVGSQKRQEMPEESTNVSIVSVSRARAARRSDRDAVRKLGHLLRVVDRQTATGELRDLRQFNRQLDHAAPAMPSFSPVDHPEWACPIALPRMPQSFRR